MRLYRLRHCLMFAALALLAGCDLIVLAPAGDIAVRQGQLVVISTLLMLLIIVPVMVLIVLFAWRYRQSNREARYEPDWDHSLQLELVIWAIPLLIIIALGALTWISTHTLDPFRPLTRIKSGQPVAADTKPLVVEVVALDWKWLFIYPEQGIAVLNEMAAPVDRPISFRITSSSVMNSFYVPALAGQIYAMPGMQSQLHAVINQPGSWEGFSANYSGAGFSQMRFRFLGMNDGDFERWVQRGRGQKATLDRTAYLELARPTEREPVQRWGQVAPDLFAAVVNRCVAPGTMCMRERMAIDSFGGGHATGVARIADALVRNPQDPMALMAGSAAGMFICRPDDPPQSQRPAGWLASAAVEGNLR